MLNQIDRAITFKSALQPPEVSKLLPPGANVESPEELLEPKVLAVMVDCVIRHRDGI